MQPLHKETSALIDAILVGLEKLEQMGQSSMPYRPEPGNPALPGWFVEEMSLFADALAEALRTVAT